MRSVAAFLICIILSGCSSFKPGERVAGHFTAVSGEIINIGSDGWVSYSVEKDVKRVGLAHIVSEEPLVIQVFGPDSTPFLGTKIAFSADRKKIEIDWQSAIPGLSKPTVFTKD